MIIPTESRAMLAAIREGLTDQQYIDAMWARRAAEKPARRKSRGKWPFVRTLAKPSNVTAIRKART